MLDDVGALCRGEVTYEVSCDGRNCVEGVIC